LAAARRSALVTLYECDLTERYDNIRQTLRSSSYILIGMRWPVATAIIICLNGERYLGEAIESVLGRTYKEWELLLVDDGSGDQSPVIATEYARRSSGRIHYLEHKGHTNRGMSASRNLGVRMARGRYVAFLDCDDVWLPQKLQQQVHILNVHSEASMAIERTRHWYSWTGAGEDRERDVETDVSLEYDRVIPPPKLLLASILSHRVRTACTCSTLVRREVFEILGGFEERFQGLYEDQVFLTKVYATQPVYAASSCLNLYRRHPHGCVVSADAYSMRAAGVAFIEWVGDYLSTAGIADQSIWTAYRAALGRYVVPMVD
jgi:glycosyltransferase involved in cell wall biosynthesis